MKNYSTLAISFLLFCYLPAAAAQLTIEVIQLQHRSADQIVPILSPLVSKGGTVTGMNDQLIIKTTPANLEQLKQVLSSLDKPLHRLIITVRQDKDGNITRQQASMDGSYRSGDVTISNSASQRGRMGTGARITEENGTDIRLRSDSSRSRLTENNNFRVQTVEGQPAWIQIGKSVPVTNRATYIGRDGVAVQDTVDYQDVTSGFYVIANINGDRVTLSVSPNMSRANPHQGGVFDVQNIETTVQGRLGEWISVGGVDQTSNRDNDSFLTGSRRDGHEVRTVLLMVEEVE